MYLLNNWEKSKVLENYFEINEETNIFLTDWIYDSIINRTMVELENNNLEDLSELFSEAKREANGFLSLLGLDTSNYIIAARNVRRAYEKSQYRRGLYSRKAHNKFLKEYKNLISALIKDDRYDTF